MLHDLELNSAVNAIKDHFNKSLEIPKRVSISKETTCNRIEDAFKPNMPLLSKVIDDTETEGCSGNEQIDGNDCRQNKLISCLKSKHFIFCFSVSILGGFCLLVLTFLLIYKSDILKCTLDMCVLDKVQSLPCKEISTNVSIKTQNEYDQAIRKFDQLDCIAVNITNLYPADWSENFRLSYSNYIRVLSISNIMSLNILFNFLSQVTYLRKLEIKWSSNLKCTFAQEPGSLLKYKIAFPFLSTLKMSNLSSCVPVYSLFSTILSFQQLETLSIENSLIDNKNIDYVRTIIYNAATTLRTIKLTGEIRSDEFLFSNNKPLVLVRTIQLDIKQRKVLLVPFDSHEIAGDNFCKAFVNIQTFENSVGIDFLDFINILKCTQLQCIKARVIMHTKDPFLNINTAFKGKELENVTLSFQFDTPCPSCEEISLLGIEDFKRRITKKRTIVFINCACRDNRDELSSNERDSFAIDHNEIKK